MDIRTGHVTNIAKLIAAMPANEVAQFVRPVNPANLSQANQTQLRRAGEVTIKPRSRCPCGSGRRFKSCCMNTPRANVADKRLP